MALRVLSFFPVFLQAARHEDLDVEAGEWGGGGGGGGVTPTEEHNFPLTKRGLEIFLL